MTFRMTKWQMGFCRRDSIYMSWHTALGSLGNGLCDICSWLALLPIPPTMWWQHKSRAEWNSHCKSYFNRTDQFSAVQRNSKSNLTSLLRLSSSKKEILEWHSGFALLSFIASAVGGPGRDKELRLGVLLHSGNPCLLEQHRGAIGRQTKFRALLKLPRVFRVWIALSLVLW